jgi:hypothetical protein
LAEKVKAPNCALRCFSVGRRLGNMAEKISRKPTSFCKFWLLAGFEGAKKSREGFGLGIEIAAVVLGIGLLVLRQYSKEHPNFSLTNGEEFVNFWVAISPFGIALAWLLFHIFKQPYKIYRDEADRRIVEREAAEMVIKELNAKLSEKSEADKLVTSRQMAKEFIGYHLLSLHNRRNEALGISRLEFEGELQKKEWEKTSELFERIRESLGKYLTSAESSIFLMAMPAALKNPDKYDSHTYKTMEWQWHVNYIEAKINELKKIVEKLG